MKKVASVVARSTDELDRPSWLLGRDSPTMRSAKRKRMFPGFKARAAGLGEDDTNETTW
jgi:hypothetical protein